MDNIENYFYIVSAKTKTYEDLYKDALAHTVSILFYTIFFFTG